MIRSVECGRMWTLRLKLDSWSQGVDEGIRQRNRDLLTDAYNRLPPCRIWLYVREDAYGFYMQAQGRFLSPRNRMRYLITTPKMKLFEESKAHFPRLPSLENS